MKKIKLSTKIIGINIFYSLLITVISLYSIYQTKSVGDELFEIARIDIPLTNSITGQVENQMKQSKLFQRSLYLYEKKSDYELLQVQEQFSEYGRKVDTQTKESILIIENTISNKKKEDNIQILTNLLEKAHAISEGHNNFEVKVNTIFAQMNSGKLAEHIDLIKDVENQELELEQINESFLDKVESITEGAVKKVEDDDDFFFRSLIIIGIFAVTVGLLIGLFVSITTTKELDAAIMSINSGMKEFKMMTDQVTSSSAILADEANAQAASLEETTAAVENLAAISESNKGVTQVSFELVKTFKKELEKVQELLVSFRTLSVQISSELQFVSDKLESYGEFNVQLNILALNATVEADRNNPEGVKTFTNEIREIAKDNFKSIKEISEKTAGIIRSAKQQSQTSGNLVTDINILIPDLEKLNEISEKILTSIYEQSNSLNEISISGQTLNQITSEVAVSSEENAELAKNMKTISNSLNEVVIKLTRITGLTALALAPELLVMNSISHSNNSENQELISDSVEAEVPDVLI